MGYSLNEIVDSIESLWPLSGAEEWDAPGVISGSGTAQVSRVLLTVDVTEEVINEAIDGEFDLVIAHHPLLMRGVKTLAEETSKGAILAKAIRNGVAIYAAHTNADIVATGVSACLAARLGLTDLTPLVPTNSPSVGHGRLGFLASSLTLGEFARGIARSIPATATGIRVAGNFEQSVSKIAVCGGAGDSFISDAYQSGADVYVTSDLRHHPVQEIMETAKAQGRKFAVIDISHWAAEWLWLEQASTEIHDRFASLQVVVSEIRTDPWDFTVTQ